MDDKKLAMTIRGIEPEVMEQLDASARKHDRTREAEVRAAIRAWIGMPEIPPGNRKTCIIPVENSGYFATKEEYECVLLSESKLENPESDPLLEHVYILAYTSVLMNNDKARDVFLNRICNTELTGMPISHVHLVLMFESTFGDESGFKAFLFELRFDEEVAYKQLPGAIQKRRGEYSWHSHAIKCGDVRVYTDTDGFSGLSQAAIMTLLSARK